MPATLTSPEVLDLRHFSAGALRPLLEDEAARWEKRLSWDYLRSVDLLLDYVNSRSLLGYVAVRRGRVAGYSFGVCEAAKAVMGDVYAFGETEGNSNPISELLLDHLIETLQATPGIDRIESQLLLYPDGSLQGPFLGTGFRPFPRCFMTCDLASQQNARTATPVAAEGYQLERWKPEFYLQAAALIQAAYLGHTDSDINDQYRTLTGAQRFLHNIVHFPGCGTFDADNSWLLRSRADGTLDGMLLCSRVRRDAAHVTQLCIRGSLRGKGLGAAMLRHFLAQIGGSGLRTASLTVTEGNAQALQLYRRYGFEVRHRFEAWVWERDR